MTRCVWLGLFVHVLARVLFDFGADSVREPARNYADPRAPIQTIFEHAHDAAMARVESRVRDMNWSRRWGGR